MVYLVVTGVSHEAIVSKDHSGYKQLYELQHVVRTGVNCIVVTVQNTTDYKPLNTKQAYYYNNINGTMYYSI